jgi:hypothetical protein
MEIELELNDGRQQEQDIREQDEWLDEQERQKVKELDLHMKRAFNEIFGG